MEGDGYKDGRKMDNFGKSLKRIMYRAGKEQIFTRIKILFLDNEEFFKSVWIHSKDKWKSLLGNSKIAESFANYIPLAKRLFKNEYHVDKDQSEEATIEYLLSVFKMITEQLKLEMGWEMESYEEEGEAEKRTTTKNQLERKSG
jgi:CTP:phosphocholine cytidylyltransferase-like protein